MASKGWLSIVGAAYRVDVDDGAWLDGLATALRPKLDGGLGIYAYRYHASNPFDYRAEPVTFYGCGAEVEAFARWAVDATSPEVVRDVLLAKCVGTASDAVGTKRMRKELTPPEQPSGPFVDSQAVNAVDPTGRACIVVAPLPRMKRMTGRERSLWSRVAAHLAAGHRLRATVDAARSVDTADAILDAKGRIQHATGEAAEQASQTALRDAALRIDRARMARTRDSDEALDLWRGLVAGRWSIIERFEADGRRLFVAWRNDPEVAIDRRLSRRETQVACWASLGHSNKLIAYELGVHTSTIATHLATAQTKLGVSDRLVLIDLIRDLRQRAPSRAEPEVFQLGGETFPRRREGRAVRSLFRTS